MKRDIMFVHTLFIFSILDVLDIKLNWHLCFDLFVS